MILPAGAAERRRLEPGAVSALFESEEAVDRAVTRLVGSGVPRDLIEVVVSPEAARRYYVGRARAPGREALRWAGIGGLTGLVLGSVLATVLIALPGFEDAGTTALIQLAGPNLATVAGACLGGIGGLLRCRRPDSRHARAAQEPDAIVLLVGARGEAEASRLAELLVGSGGREPRITTRTHTS
ncbi:MAG TPA: hypothetical protein VF212_04060 [Longimicrobiales bacterium]